jgi:hypothetical protein
MMWVKRLRRKDSVDASRQKYTDNPPNAPVTMTNSSKASS